MSAVAERRAPASGAAVYGLVLLCLANAFNYVDRSALGLVLPQIKAELHMSDSLLGLASGLPFSLCYALCAVPAAWLADRWRRAPLVGISLAVWSLTTWATAAVGSGLQLAVTRLFLGAAESPGLPASASMIADLFGPKWRPLAFGGLASSAYVGVLVGFPLLGVIAQHRGWRDVFTALGVPGLVLAALFLLTVREPRRVTLEGAEAALHGPPLASGLAALMRTPSFLLVTAAGALSAVNLASMFGWGPTFLARIHHLQPQEIGGYFGTLRGAAGLIGALSFGVLLNLLVRRNPAWQVRAPAAMAVLLFATDAAFLFGSGWVWKAGLFASALLAAAIVAASYGLYVGVVGARTRALAAAVYLLTATLVGQTLGPLIVGVLNDLLAPMLGEAAIRWSMLAASSATCLSGLAVALAGQTWMADSQRALQA